MKGYHLLIAKLTWLLSLLGQCLLLFTADCSCLGEDNPFQKARNMFDPWYQMNNAYGLSSSQVQI